MRSEVAAVSCPSCGVGLQALGGGRVVLQVCAHCGAALDVVDNYRLLKKFADMPRPDTPLRPGMTGRVAGVEWTVIGLLGWTEAYGGSRWTWTDHQLYAPTHGYAWLTLEEGHLIFTRHYRGEVSPPWFTAMGVEACEKRPNIAAKGRSFAYYETSASKVTFAKGEFSWAVLVGDGSEAVSFLSEDAMLSYSESNGEREVEWSSYPPQAETWASFGVPPATPLRIHPLQPYQAWRDERFLSRLGMVGTAAAAVLGISLMSMGAPVVPEMLPAPGHLDIEADLPITTTQGLVEIRLRTDVHNAWAGMETELSDPSGAVLFETAREVGYYEGYEDGESWSEGSQETSIFFHPQEAGTYGLSLSVPEGGTGEGNAGPVLSRPLLQVFEGKAAWGWMLMAFVLFVPMAAVSVIRSGLHRKARWRGSDWTDEESGGDD